MNNNWYKSVWLRPSESKTKDRSQRFSTMQIENRNKNERSTEKNIRISAMIASC